VSPAVLRRASDRQKEVHDEWLIIRLGVLVLDLDLDLVYGGLDLAGAANRCQRAARADGHRRQHG
jgi:hypothetical protein